MIEANNIFFISNFNVIGGVETFIYELARKYDDYDIVVIYNTGDESQLRRLKKYVRVIKYDGQKIKCKKAFFNYELNLIDKVEADEYIRIVHAMFKTQGLHPSISNKMTKYLSVSDGAGEEWEDVTGCETITCRNPLSITKDEKEPALLLISATRLTKEKGKNRMIKLAELLDKANINYLWFIFTNDKEKINNKNIIYLEPRLNIRPFIASIRGKGYGVQLSDCEGDCYFTKECEGLGVPLLVTPIPSFEEQGLVDGENCYYLPFDMENIDIKKIATKIPEYKGYIGEDRWNEELSEGESQYKKDLNTKVLVKSLIAFTDIELNKKLPKDYEYEVNKVRAEDLVNKGLVEIKEVKKWD